MVSRSLFKQWSAIVPIAMSIAGLLVVLAHIAVFGLVNAPDETASVRVFWLLMGLQIPVAAYFALLWLPRRPKQALVVIAVQAVLWFAAWTPVYILESVSS